jgi:HK97 family phage major capsid protein
LDSSLLWALEKEAEEQLLFGAGVGQNLDGLTLNAQAFDTTILSASAGWTYADVLAAAGVQLMEDGFNPTHYAVSVRDWFALETLKDSQKRYIIGSPRDSFRKALWGKAVIPSPAMTTGFFDAYDAGRNVIRQRQMATVDVSFEHASNFTENKATIRAEERLALVTMHPSSVVYGNLTNSPA